MSFNQRYQSSLEDKAIKRMDLAHFKIKKSKPIHQSLIHPFQ